jgi:hypothetical protein
MGGMASEEVKNELDSFGSAPLTAATSRAFVVKDGRTMVRVFDNITSILPTTILHADRKSSTEDTGQKDFI